KIARLSMAGPSWHPFWATSAAASALASAASSTCSPQPHRPPHLLSAGPKQAKSRNTHSSQPVARRFGLRGLSGAYRQPKLFTEAAVQHCAPFRPFVKASPVPRSGHHRITQLTASSGGKETDRFSAANSEKAAAGQLCRL